ncbi:ParM/StbA family protein [Romboutsia sp.]|uniref:ParM/StbA family protein n=1 Tax=Romboutsia sp. TaxID=1965302 RepID=UPI002C401A78|nr:ParM/StbA family protein [Romboutsia sp.]HSQ88707.1 ParM/StbA family protein [Romboutsia sp.]
MAIKKLGIDIGNFAVKTSEGVIFESKITDKFAHGSTADTIKLGNITYCIGEGDEEIGYKKFEKENFIPLLIGAICKSTDEEVVDLALGLPVKQFANHKNDVINMLQGKIFKVRYKNEVNEREIFIKSVQVFPEGVTGYLHFSKDVYDKVGSRDVVIIDVGGKTTDIALIKSNKAEKPYSIDIGTIDIYDTIAKSIETDKRFESEVKVPRDKVQDYIDKGFYFKGEKQDIRPNIAASMDLFKKIYNELKLNYPIATEAVIVMGGGAKLLGAAFKNNVPGIIVMDNIDNYVFANANGYRKMMK